MPSNEIKELCYSSFEMLRPNGVFFVFCSDKQLSDYQRYIPEAGFYKNILFTILTKESKFIIILLF